MPEPDALSLPITQGSIGFAESQATPQPATALPPPSVPTTKNTQGPALGAPRPFRARVPQFGKSTAESIAAIGFLLSQFAAGFRGQETPLEKIRRQQILEERNALAMMDATVNFVSKAQTSIASAPAGQRAGLVSAFKKINSEFGNLIDPKSLDDLGKLGTLANFAGLVKGLNDTERNVLLSVANGDQNKVVELLGNKEFMAQLQQSTDFTNRPIVQKKLSDIVHSLPAQALADITDPATGLIDLTMPQLQAINDQIKKANPNEAFTDGELGTIMRNPSDYGFVTPELRAKRAEVRTGQALGEGDALTSAFVAREMAMARGDREQVKAQTDRINKLTQAKGTKQGLVAVPPSNDAQYPATFDSNTGEFLVDRGNGFEPLPQGWVPMRLPTVQAASAGEAILHKGQTMAARKIYSARALALDSAGTIGSQATRVGAVLAELHKLPEGTTGVRGNIVDALGGYFSQIDKSLGQDFVKLMTGGATKAEFNSFRIRARTIIAANVGEVVGEKGAKISDRELAITEEALKLLESGASKDQIETTMQELLIQKLLEEDFLKARAGEPPFPVGRNEPGWREAVKKYSDERLTPLGINLEGQKKLIELIRQNRDIAMGIVSAENDLITKSQ